jgi:hypothetical protein
MDGAHSPAAHCEHEHKHKHRAVHVNSYTTTQRHTVPEDESDSICGVLNVIYVQRYALGAQVLCRQRVTIMQQQHVRQQQASATHLEILRHCDRAAPAALELQHLPSLRETYTWTPKQCRRPRATTTEPRTRSTTRDVVISSHPHRGGRTRGTHAPCAARCLGPRPSR